MEMKQMSSFSEWQMEFKIELKECFWMLKFLDVLGSHESRCSRSSAFFYISESSATHHKNRCKITPATTPSTSFWWWVPSSRRRGGRAGREGPGPGARGGTEDDDEG
jgi:hypothetical protein